MFWLGLAGFRATEVSAISALLPRPADLPRWGLGNFGEADAWLLNGVNCRVLAGGDLMVAAEGEQGPLRLDLSGADRPVAFASPIPDDLEPVCRCDAASRVSLQAMTLQFDNWLRFERAQFALGGQIVHMGAVLRHGIFHLMHQGKLLAVLDFRKGQAGVAPAIHPLDVEQAEWHKRPSGAGDLPPSFVDCSTSELAWKYVRRVRRDMLPEAYHGQTIYFRREPRVPIRLLGDRQLLLLRELSARPGTLADLARRTGAKTGELVHPLACLYYAGSITTTLSKAAQPVSAPTSSVLSAANHLAQPRPDHGTPCSPEDLTAPAVLKAHKGIS